MPSSTTPHDLIIVFARAPQLGRVKTRLGAAIGDEAALAAYQELGRISWSSAIATRQALGCRAVVHYTPSLDDAGLRDWLPAADDYVAQAGVELGARMLNAISAALDDGARRVVVMGTDCPTLSHPIIARAFSALDSADVVIGPALDGGYYLIGMSVAHATLFVDVPWSSQNTLAVTMERATAAALRVALLEPMRDVDTADDWHAWRHATGRER